MDKKQTQQVREIPKTGSRDWKFHITEWNEAGIDSMDLFNAIMKLTGGGAALVSLIHEYGEACERIGREKETLGLIDEEDVRKALLEAVREGVITE